MELSGRRPGVIDLIKKLVGAGAEQGGSAPDASGEGSTRRRDVRLAACAVFLEMAQIDNEFDARERDHIAGVFEREFGLPPEDVARLREAAADELARSKDCWTLTHVINQHYGNEEKYRLVELLWELVYADGRMDEHENYFMHKLSKLLQLTHRDLIDAKLSVLHRHAPPGESGGGEGGTA